jgi:Terpene synthase family 2, C-terminal metal binding
MISMPEFYCPVLPAESPHAREAERQVVEWLDKFEIYQSPVQRDYFARCRFPEFPARSLPQAEPDLLVLPGKEVMWLQSFDDVHSDEKPGGTPLDEYIVMLARLTRIIEDPHAPLLTGNPWANALRDLRLELAEKATAVQVDRWVQATIEYFDGLLWEAVNRTRNAPPSVDDYVAMWLKQSGVYPCIVFTDIVCGYEVPAADWARPSVRTLREMVAAIIGWDNDLTSFDKEVHRSVERGFPPVQNLVSVIAAQYGCTIDQAAAIAGAMRNRAMIRFIRMSDEVTAQADKPLACYVRGLGQWIRGYLDYSGRSARYTDPANPDDAAIASRLAAGWKITDRPPDEERPGLPVLPSIDSWWA